MAKGTSLKTTIAARGGNKNYPVITLARKKPELAAMVSKLITNKEQTAKYDQHGNREAQAPDIGAFRALSSKVSQSIIDSRTTLQLLPDLEITAQLLISGIISPKDYTTTEITYLIAEGLLPPDIGSSMISEVRKYFDQVYKIKDLLPEMLKKQLFDTGSYPVAVIPENAIDEIINGNRIISNESLSSLVNSDGKLVPTGILGPVAKSKPTVVKTLSYSIESFMGTAPESNIEQEVDLRQSFDGKKVETHLSVTDNPAVLKIPYLHQKVRSAKIHKAIGGYGMESALSSNPSQYANRLTDRELTGAVFKQRNYTHQPIAAIKTQNQLNRYSVGEPLIMHLPSEAVIPVHVPGRPSEQVGVFVLLDGEGYPLSRANAPDEYSKLQNRMNSTASFSSAMLEKVKTQMTGFDYSNPGAFDYCARAYGDFVEKDMLARLRNGLYDNGVALAKSDEIYRIMFARAMSQQNTQLLFLPIEFTTYMAFDFNQDGIGTSLLEANKILNSMRVMMMFADVMAGVRNSIGRTDVQVKLDPEDPDPNKTRENIIHEIARSRVSSFPLGANTVTEMIDGIMQAGIEIHVTGHDGLPDMDIQFSEKNTNFVKTDTELKDELRKQSIMGAGMTPEMVDSSFQPEFATIFAENNVMMAKRTLQYQDKFCPQLSDHARKVVGNSSNLRSRLLKVLDANFDDLKKFLKNRPDIASANFIDILSTEVKDVPVNGLAEDQDETKAPSDETMDKNKRQIIERVLAEFIGSLELTLPRPTSITLEKQMASLVIYSDSVEKALEAYMETAAMTSATNGLTSEQIDSIRASFRNYFVRQYMAENGILPELGKLTALGSNGDLESNIIEDNADHNDAINELIISFLKQTQKSRDKSNKFMEKQGIQPPTGGGDYNATTDFGGGDFGSTDTSLDEGGGFGDETNLDDNPATPGDATKTEEEAQKTDEDVPAEDGGAGGGEKGASAEPPTTTE